MLISVPGLGFETGDGVFGAGGVGDSVGLHEEPAGHTSIDRGDLLKHCHPHDMAAPN